ncbi:hypothetical protein SKAU_G00141950 [Synaphobranchus kaupii]|uniref:Uncharacterized protein n=1 Tax=Synaphobranchus kaupii TaxID=118154 RepID=A0A9Q1FST7_SYNKA|nr:hypothetical protein SKAU_G00141950 [Synaphobranchus kaupii]
MHLELQSNIMQEKLDAKDLPQDTGSTLLTSDSEHHDKESEVKDVIQSQKQTKETEQDRCHPQDSEKIKKMESDQASLNGEKTNVENLYKILEEKFQIMHNLCEQKDSTLQQKLVEEKLEQHVKEIKSGGRKEEIRNFKQRIQEINEKHERTQSGLKKQTQVKLPNAVEEERNLYLEKLQLEEKKTHQLEYRDPHSRGLHSIL